MIAGRCFTSSVRTECLSITKGQSESIEVYTTKMGLSCIANFKREFTLGKCSPKTRNPQLILRPQWRVHPVGLLLYRSFTVIYTLSWCIADAVRINSPKWLIYLTNQSYVILTIYFILALVNLIVSMALGWRKSEQNIEAGTLEEISSSSPVPEAEDGTPSRKLGTEFYPSSSALYPTICIQWVLHNIACVFALYVTVTFWVFLHVPGRFVDSFIINLHGINAVLVLVELFVTAAPIHLTHFVYAFSYHLMFILFTVIYWGAGGTNHRGKPYIYRLLNYGEKPGPAVGYLILGTCIALPLLQFLVWNLYLLRRQVYFKCTRKGGDVPHC